MPRPTRYSPYVTTCGDCGKWCYASKAAAKVAARQMLNRTGPPLCRPYKCGAYWHLTSEPRSAAAGYRERRIRA